MESVLSGREEGEGQLKLTSSTHFLQTLQAGVATREVEEVDF